MKPLGIAIVAAIGLSAAVVAVVLGVVEGLTEYLPVSSTGHLIIVGELLGLQDYLGSKEVVGTFEIFIQLGAILAVVVAYPGRFIGLLRWNDNRGFSGLRGLFLLFLTSLPGGLLGLVARPYIKEHLFQPLTVAIGFIVGAVWILAAERFMPRTRREGVDSLDWKDALGIGLFQCFGLWPGMSRSLSTIFGGTMLGVERKTATEYSFFAAVPILTAATLYELYKSRGLLHASHLPMFAIGFVVSFFAAWAAVKFLIRFVSHHTFVPFAWYRLALAAGVLGWIFFGPHAP